VRAHRIHSDEFEVDASLVRTLLADQYPRWADLPLRPVTSWGTDNALFRLGDDMVVRLPIHEASTHDLSREERWVPFVASTLPVRVPMRLARGEPAHAYPFHWCVWQWIEGANPVAGQLADPHHAARELARVVRGLHAIEPSGGPPAGRGVPLTDADRDGRTREAIAQLRGIIDVDLVGAAWEAALRVPAWTSAPVWVHGDLTPGNLIYVAERLVAVLDWSGVGIGDPACDLLPAWNLLPAEARPTFREALDVDDATWERGRGWALSTAVIALPYYLNTNAGMVAMAERKLVELFGPAVLVRR
jgi:aminoglycoside phosphotransferase (APT) family kinase protein